MARDTAQQSRTLASQHRQPLAQTVLDALAAQVAVIDEAGEIVSVNQAWREFAKTNAGDPQAMSEGANYLAVCDEAEGPDSHWAHQAATGLRLVVSGAERQFYLEYPCDSPTESRWFILRGTPCHSQGQRFVVVSHDDITQRKHAEQRLEERDRQLQRIDRMGLMQELAAGIGHELKQPLAAIHNYSEGILQQLKQDPMTETTLARVRDGVARLTEQSARAGHIINQLRAFTRNGDAPWQRVEVATLINDAIELANNTAIDNDVTLHSTVASDLKPILARPVALQQVLLNLLTNAMQAIQKNEASAPRRIHLTAAPADPSQVQITVRDTGPVADATTVASMFHPFQSSKADGLGIGLNICETMIAQHAGRIWAEPNVDRGISVHIVLPIAPEAALH
jgi:two-component system sensor histidine kinase TtrS